MAEDPETFTNRLWRWLVIAIWALRQILRTAWGIARGPIIAALQVLAALIVLFEEWGWKPLSELLARLANFGPIAILERRIAGLGPYGALVVFVLPTTFLLPLKFLAMWLLAQGQVWAASGLFIGAKIASTALVARIFTLTKPALMQLGWFARAYNRFVPWKDALFAQIRSSWVWRYGRMVKTRVRLEAKQAWGKWRPLVVARWELLRPRIKSANGRLSATLRDAWARLTGS